VNYSCSLASFRSKQAFPTLPNPTHPRMCVSGEENGKTRERNGAKHQKSKTPK